MCVCALVCVCGSVCVVCVREMYIMFIYYFFRLMCIFVGLTDFVKRDVLILVNEIPHFRNCQYYHYLLSAFAGGREYIYMCGEGVGGGGEV